MGVIDEKHSGSDRNSTDVRDAEFQYAAEEVQCPSHTTERKLMAKIDMRVVPFLCIMYLLAFLGKSTSHGVKYPLRVFIRRAMNANNHLFLSRSC
jgi:hypothetical protein